MEKFISPAIFLIILGIAIFIITKRVNFIRKGIKMGRAYRPEGSKSERFRAMVLYALGQKKMFKKFIPAIFHFFIYLGFIIINLEVLEFIIDGIVGTHRIFAGPLGSAYSVAINIFEIFAVLVIVACVVFLIRRNLLRVNRFSGQEMRSWPKLDANLILIIEIILMFAILTMNATDQLLQQKQVAGYPQTGTFYISSVLFPIFAGMDSQTLVFVERFAWWFHIIGILAFAVYITYSKHLHIFISFPNTYFSSFRPQGEMNNMPEVTKEVKMMLGIQDQDQSQSNPEDIPRLGVKDVNDLSWKSLMEAYSCTECGRCTQQCPANITGKKLSPRKIMMDTRDRLEEVTRGGLDDGKSLLNDYVTQEELNACTTCNACVEACPVNINPMSIILQMRRYVAMEESGSPASWNNMYQNMETSFAPWKFPASDRFKWADELKNNSDD